ncbi:MAG: PKD domain-containing protein [Planctomycetes bacterium]|nr:PKD domain-containing protein [Planctomycetota bacterium]
MKWTIVWTAVLMCMLAAQGGTARADDATYQIAASADDCFCTSSSATYNSSTLYWPYLGTNRLNFLRWACNIPSGATITSAYVKLMASGTTTNTATGQMQLVDSDNCPAFSSNPWSSSVTGPTVGWTVPGVTSGTWYTSPDVGAIVQAFIDRPGYSQGNYLGLRNIYVSHSGDWVSKTFYTWDHSTHAYGPQLEVTYTTNQSPVADAGEDQEIEDTDDDGLQSVTLDGSDSSDSDGTIVSYVWTEGETELATGQTAGVDLAPGEHTITLTVTDNGGATDSDTVDVTITEPDRVVVLQMLASEDDSSATSSSNNSHADVLYWPYSNATKMSFLRWRFLVPEGATITEAYVKVKASSAMDSNPSVVRLEQLDYDDCPNFYSENPWTWSVTAGHVDTTVPAVWTTDTWYDSADITTLVQAFIDRPGYAIGNYFGLRASYVSGLWKVAYGWDYGDHSNAPQLEIHYAADCDTVLELWMADPEVRLGQKVYCQIMNRRSTDTLRVKLDGDVIHTQSAPLASEEVFTVDYRELDAGEHTLLVEILDSDNNVRTSASRTWTKLHEGIAAVAIDENNAICRNGVPFFPITPWGIDSSSFSTWEGQINTLCGQSFALDKNLDAWVGYLGDAMEEGYAAMGPGMGDYWAGGYDTNIVEIPPDSGNWVYIQELDQDRLTDYIEASRDCPEFLMYVWKDEPDLGNPTQYIPATEIHNWTELGHSLDTEHLHYINLVGYGFTHGGTYPLYNNLKTQTFCFLYNDRYSPGVMGDIEPFDKKTVMCDVLAMDYYPYERTLQPGYSDWIGLEDLALALDRMREWNYDLIPTMTWIETCDINENTGQYYTPAPTPTQLNHLVWMSIIHGVKGIQWFHYFLATPAENRAVMTTATQWITVLTQPILSAPENVTWTVTEEELGDERVDIMTRQVDSQLYIFAAHMIRSGEGETVRFNIDGLASGQTIGVLGEGRTITSSAGYFEDTFSTLAVHIYTYPALVNMSPVADPGLDQNANDSDLDGYETVTLDGTDSFDADGSLVSYVWVENSTPIATGSTAQVSLSTGEHEITLVVTDDDSATGSDTVIVTVNVPPVADAGSDQEVEDTDNDGYETITLDGSDSSDSDGTIASYVWSEGGTEIATGETASVVLVAGTHNITLTVTDYDGGTDSDDVEVEVVNENVLEAQYQIAASADDTWCTSSDTYYANSTLYVPYVGTSRVTFLRWPITIPDGATILNATVQVKSTGGKADAYDSAARLQLVDSDSCPDFTSNPYAWTLTAGYVDWTIPGAWATDTWYMSGDISALVQEFIDRGGYSSGNYLGLRCAQVSGSYKTAYQWNSGSHTDGAILTIKYLP